MEHVHVIEGVAVLAQLPLLLPSLRDPARRDLRFWIAATVAFVAAALVAAVLMAGGWQSGFVATLWTTLAGTLAVYLGLAVTTGDGWRLAPLVGGYATIVAGLSFLIGLGTAEASTPPEVLPEAWFTLHVATAVTTYAFVTLAAIAAFAASVQERALKNKQPTWLSRRLPSMTGCEMLSLRLLTVGVVVLAAGLVTGVAIEYVTRGDVLPFTHKTVLTLAAFIVLTTLLAAQLRWGVRGRRAVRLILLGYLLLTLGYPGVKFVTDVLLRR